MPSEFIRAALKLAAATLLREDDGKRRRRALEVVRLAPKAEDYGV